MIFSCYFCQQPLVKHEHSLHIEWCQNCYQQHDVRVYTSFSNKDNKIISYVHIYLGKYLGKGNNRLWDWEYHIRFNVKDNLTEVFADNIYDKPILVLPDFPFTTDNAKEKLKLYLLFS